MALRKICLFNLFLFNFSITVYFFSGCTGKPYTPQKNSSHINMNFSISEEAFFVLEKLDSFNPDDRLKGAKFLSDSKKLKELIKISDAVNPENAQTSAAYLALSNEAVVALYPAIHALFTAALDIQPDIKENAFHSLREISTSLLKIILTTYSIKNASPPSSKKKEDAMALLNKAKAINEDIITFFRNEPFDGNKNVAGKILRW